METTYPSQGGQGGGGMGGGAIKLAASQFSMVGSTITLLLSQLPPKSLQCATAKRDRVYSPVQDRQVKLDFSLLFL